MEIESWENQYLYQLFFWGIFHCHVWLPVIDLYRWLAYDLGWGLYNRTKEKTRRKHQYSTNSGELGSGDPWAFRGIHIPYEIDSPIGATNWASSRPNSWIQKNTFMEDRRSRTSWCAPAMDSRRSSCCGKLGTDVSETGMNRTGFQPVLNIRHASCWHHVTGWWFGTMNGLWFSHHIENVIIPTDELSIIFQGGQQQPPTRSCRGNHMEDLNSLQITKPQNEAMVQNHQPPVPQYGGVYSS